MSNFFSKENNRAILCFEKNKNDKADLICKVIKKTKKVYWLKKGLSHSDKNAYSVRFNLKSYWENNDLHRKRIAKLILEAAGCPELIKGIDPIASKQLCDSIQRRRRKILNTTGGAKEVTKALTSLKSNKAQELIRFGVKPSHIRQMIKTYGSSYTFEYYNIIANHPTPTVHIPMIDTIPRKNFRGFLNLLQHSDDSIRWVLRDINNMASSILEHNPSYKIPIKDCRSLTDLDRILARDYSRIKTKKVDFNYNDYQKNLEDEIDGYVFTLPKDTHELLDYGERFGNCVGSYGTQILHHGHTIVVGSLNEDVRLCIDIVNGEISQAFSKCNSLPKRDDANVLAKWKQKKNIKDSSYF